MSILTDKMVALRQEISLLDITAFEHDQGENINKEPLVSFSFTHITQKSVVDILIALNAGKEIFSMENINLLSVNVKGKRSRKQIFSLLDRPAEQNTIFSKHDRTILHHGPEGNIYPHEFLAKSLYYKPKTEAFVIRSIDTLLKVLHSHNQE